MADAARALEVATELERFLPSPPGFIHDERTIVETLTEAAALLRRSAGVAAIRDEVADTLCDVADLIASLRQARAPRAIEAGDLLLNVIDYYNLDELAERIAAALAGHQEGER